MPPSRRQWAGGIWPLQLVGYPSRMCADAPPYYPGGTGTMRRRGDASAGAGKMSQGGLCAGMGAER